MKNAKCLRAALAALTLAFSTAALAADRWPSSLPKLPSIYLVKGYLDRAPAGVIVADEIEITGRGGGPIRKFLVTEYRTPGETPLDLYLSRAMPHRYSIAGRPDLVRRVIDAPAGALIEGKFLAYTYGVPMLVVAELVEPAPAS